MRPLLIRNLVGVGLLAVGVVIVVGLIDVWPSVIRLTGNSPPKTDPHVHYLFGAFTLSVGVDGGLLLTAILAGALGGYAGAAAAFSEHVGAGDFKAQWAWWYLLRVPVGIAVGVLVYFAFRGGLLSPAGSSKDVNPYGVAALAGLGGLFSRQAMARLENILEGLRTGPVGNRVRGQGQAGPR